MNYYYYKGYKVKKDDERTNIVIDKYLSLGDIGIFKDYVEEIQGHEGTLIIILNDRFIPDIFRDLLIKISNTTLELPNDYWSVTLETKEQQNYDLRTIVFRQVTKEQRYEVLKRQKWACNICGCVLRYSKASKWNGKIAHIDHIHPFSKRNSYINGPQNINETENLQALCEPCNLSKKDKQIN